MHVLMVGCGEYTVGIPPPPADANTRTLNNSDKKLGVVALVMMDLRQRGLVKWVGLAGTQASKVSKAAEWLNAGIGKQYSMPAHLDDTWPKEGTNSKAYEKAIDQLPKGSAVTIFTPDNTHFEMASYAIRCGMHVMIAKPAVMKSAHHGELCRLASTHKVLCCIEFHKRFDPIYQDASEQLSQLGDFTYFASYMSQPKYQLETFRHWAGKYSDISFYLNSHHIDFLTWSLQDKYRVTQVMAMGSTGVATSEPYSCVAGTEDGITLLVKFQNRLSTSASGVAVFTSAWTAPNKTEVHSQQKFQFLGATGEVRVDQAHRGYELTTDDRGYQSKNPLFMKYTPSKEGKFAGQDSYGYKSFAVWIEACRLHNAGKLSIDDVTGKIVACDDYQISCLATIQSTLVVTQILEAGLFTDEKVTSFCNLDHITIPMNPVFWMTCIDTSVDPRGISIYRSRVADDIVDALLRFKADLPLQDPETLRKWATAQLDIFIQDNFTGPPSNLDFPDIVEISRDFLGSDQPITSFSSQIPSASLSLLQEIGHEDISIRIYNPFSLLVATWIAECLSCGQGVQDSDSLLLARCYFLLQRISQHSSEVLYKQLTGLLTKLSDSKFTSNEEHAKFWLFKGLVMQYYFYEKAAFACFKEAQTLSGLEWNLTGRLGKRTKFQEFTVSQLSLDVFKETSISEVVTTEVASVPKSVPLDDDQLLDTVEYSTPLPSSPLSLLDQCILMAFCMDIKNSNPENGLTSEQMSPFIEYLIANPQNFSLHTLALYTRSRLDALKRRKIERSIMQIRALVDQFPIVDAEVGGASREVRMACFWECMLPMRAEMMSELGRLYVGYGMSRSALDIYLELERWEEVIHCYMLMDEVDKAEKCVLEQLALPNAPRPRLLCIMGDLKDDPSYYEQAWTASGGKHALSMRLLAKAHVKAGKFEEAATCFKNALEINALFPSIWFSYGCVLMQLERWEDAQQAFLRSVQQDSSNGESWNNLAAIHMRLGRKRDAMKCFKEGLRELYDSWKMWENYMSVALECDDLPEAMNAASRIFDLKWGKLDGKKGTVDYDLLTGFIRALHASEDATNEKIVTRFEEILVNISKVHILDHRIHLLLANFYRCFPSENSPHLEVLKCLEAAYRAVGTLVPYDNYYETDDFGLACSVCTSLVDEYILASHSPRGKSQTDYLFEARMILRRLIKRSAEAYEGSELHEGLKLKLDQVVAAEREAKEISPNKYLHRARCSPIGGDARLHMLFETTPTRNRAVCKCKVVGSHAKHVGTLLHIEQSTRLTGYNFDASYFEFQPSLAQSEVGFVICRKCLSENSNGISLRVVFQTSTQDLYLSKFQRFLKLDKGLKVGYLEHLGCLIELQLRHFDNGTVSVLLKAPVRLRSLSTRYATTKTRVISHDFGLLGPLSLEPGEFTDCDDVEQEWCDARKESDDEDDEYEMRRYEKLAQHTRRKRGF